MRALEDKRHKEANTRKKIASKESDNRHIRAEMDDYERKKQAVESRRAQARAQREEAEAKRADIEAAQRTLEQDRANAENAVDQAAAGIARKKSRMKNLHTQLSKYTYVCLLFIIIII